MRDILVRLLRSQDSPSPKIIGLLWMLMLGLVGGVVACTPAAADAPAIQSHPYTFYLYAWTEDNPDNSLIPLDPETLYEEPTGKVVELGQTWRLSADGSTLISVEYGNGRANQDPETIWIVVQDFPSGMERTRFHPPAAGLVSTFSDDGRRLLL